MNSPSCSEENCSCKEGNFGETNWEFTEQGWSVFFHCLGQRVYRYLCRILGNSTDAEECLQETFIRFFINFGNYDQNKPLLPYLIVIARNVAYNYRRGNVFSESLDNKNRTAVFNEDTALRNSELGLMVESIIECAGLNEMQSEVFTLMVFHNLKSKDLAFIFDTNPKSMRQFIWRMRKQIQRYLGLDDIISPI